MTLREADESHQRAATPGQLRAARVVTPRPRPGLVERPALVARVRAGLELPLTLVCAPAGAGKTTLLAQALAAAAGPAAWVSLEHGDNRPAHFWAAVAAALDQLRPGAGRGVRDLLTLPVPPGPELVPAAVVADAARHGVAGVLVLDDYHLITAPEIHHDLGWLVERLPQGLRLAIASRSRPPLPLARLLARGQLAEIAGSALRFTQAEAAALLNGTLGLALPAATVAALHTRSEGWSVGLHLAALALRDGGTAPAAAGGGGRAVAEYFASEVLDGLPAELRRLLLATAVLPAFCAELAAAVLDEDGPDGGAAATAIQELVRRELFVVALDDAGRWFRYHHLFADVLRAVLEREQPGQAQLVRRRGARWHAAYGDPDEAARLARAAADWSLLADLALRRGPELAWRHGELATVHAWLAAMPPEQLAARPALLLLQARIAVSVGSVAEAHELLEATGAAAAADPALGASHSAIGALVAFRRGQLAEALAAARRSLAARPDPTFRADLLLIQGTSLMLLAELDAARAVLQQAVAAAKLFGQHSAYWLCVATRLRCGMCVGELGWAQEFADELLAGPNLADMHPYAGIVVLGRAWVRYERNQLAEAEADVDASIQLLRPIGYTRNLAGAHLLRATIAAARGEGERVEAELRVAQRYSAQIGSPMHQSELDLWRAHLLLAAGEPERAAPLLDRWEAEPSPVPLVKASAAVIIAWGWSLRRHPDRALAILEQQEPQLRSGNYGAALVDLLIVRAGALQARGERGAAVAALAEALALAAPQGMVRCFINRGPAIARLLDAACRAVEPPLPPHLRAFARHLLDAFAPTERPRARSAEAVPLLSERERAILALVADGCSNRAIAERLLLAESSVKTYLKQLYRKLGVASRTEALARARGIGLL